MTLIQGFTEEHAKVIALNKLGPRLHLFINRTLESTSVEFQKVTYHFMLRVVTGIV
jgi:hypothetical protein